MSISSHPQEQKCRSRREDGPQTSAPGCLSTRLTSNAGCCPLPACPRPPHIRALRWRRLQLGETRPPRAPGYFTSVQNVKDSLSLPVSGKADPELPTRFIMKTESYKKTHKSRKHYASRKPKIAQFAVAANGALREGKQKVLGCPKFCK